MATATPAGTNLSVQYSQLQTISELLTHLYMKKNPYRIGISTIHLRGVLC